MAVQKADVVLHEGTVLGHPDCDSLAVGDDRILALGAFRDLKSLIGPRTRMIRLAGRTVAAGFIDCHQHFMEGAAVASGISVLRCRTIGDLLADLRAAASKSPPGNWLRAFGGDETLIRDRRGPTLAELDQTVPKNPLRLRHQTLHASWLNSRAISALGLECPDFVPPDGARMMRDATGRLTGLVVGMEDWLSSHLPRVTAAELESRARFFSRELAAAGITAFTDATVRNGPDDIATFARLVASGVICQHAAMMIGPSYIEDATALRETAADAGIRLAAIKFTNVPLWETPRLVRAIADALALGIDCAFHATEVEELVAAVDAIELARERVPAGALESTVCRIEHGGLIPPDYPARIAASGAWVVGNPGFIYYRGAKYTGEPGLIPHLYRTRSLAAAGVSVAAGTDAPVTPAKPFSAIAAAVERVSIEGYELAPQEKIPLVDAFALFTTAASRLSRLGAGRIEPGRRADLIILPANPLTLKPAELVNLAADLTIVGGRTVYDRARPIAAQAAGAGLFSA